MGRPWDKRYNDPTIQHRDTETWYRIRQRLTAVKIMCADGATNAQIAKFLGVSIYTIVTYRQRYPEFNECFRQGRAEMVDKLEGKMYQLAMGIVDTNITKTITKEVTEEVEDPETGELEEVVHTKTIRTNIREQGYGTPDAAAGQFLLKNLAPEKYNVKPIESENELEAVQVVDDIDSNDSGVDAEPKLFYDDSQDAPNND